MSGIEVALVTHSRERERGNSAKCQGIPLVHDGTAMKHRRGRGLGEGAEEVKCHRGCCDSISQKGRGGGWMVVVVWSSLTSQEPSASRSVSCTTSLAAKWPKNKPLAGEIFFTRLSGIHRRTQQLLQDSADTHTLVSSRHRRKAEVLGGAVGIQPQPRCRLGRFYRRGTFCRQSHLGSRCSHNWQLIVK